VVQGLKDGDGEPELTAEANGLTPAKGKFARWVTGIALTEKGKWRKAAVGSEQGSKQHELSDQLGSGFQERLYRRRHTASIYLCPAVCDRPVLGAGLRLAVLELALEFCIGRLAIAPAQHFAEKTSHPDYSGRATPILPLTFFSGSRRKRGSCKVDGLPHGALERNADVISSRTFPKRKREINMEAFLCPGHTGQRP
jgi:hypothetical protein